MSMIKQLPEWMRRKLTATALMWLKQTCTIEENNAITGEYGEASRLWQIVASNVPCRIIQAAASRSTTAVNEAGAQENILVEYRLEVPNTTVLRSDQRVTVDGVQYSIVRVEEALTDDLFRQAIITRRA